MYVIMTVNKVLHDVALHSNNNNNNYITLSIHMILLLILSIDFNAQYSDNNPTRYLSLKYSVNAIFRYLKYVKKENNNNTNTNDIICTRS